ncbi:putative TPR repeat methyltransferase [Rhodovulum iodosum]|uniref:TPR repeat methyltransferase n=1 Tax=Rhodovulum iodosum TaxID=68291 RepID=A0ABV3XUA1_9RHOB|nr:methyltransferase domain-containing protein [Rhodovulum robiginosum]RSK38485.1 methyltransferase domain-containing protein [Rhodovulum robiginosum]
MAQKKFLNKVYDVETRDEVETLYDAWADSYDAELVENGYATPGRVARAMAKTGCKEPVLDLGCGTGLSAEAMRAEGFQTIDGTDLSAGMLDAARAKGVYRKLWVTDPDAPLPDGYATIAAVGVVSPGAGGPELLYAMAGALSRGGRLAFSFNDHALADPAYTGHLNELLDTGAFRLLHAEKGDHIPEIGLNSTVYILEKT